MLSSLNATHSNLWLEDKHIQQVHIYEEEFLDQLSLRFILLEQCS